MQREETSFNPPMQTAEEIRVSFFLTMMAPIGRFKNPATTINDLISNACFVLFYYAAQGGDAFAESNRKRKRAQEDSICPRGCRGRSHCTSVHYGGCQRFNPYAVKRGSSECNKQQQWREQARIDFITEQQRVRLAPDLLRPAVGDENQDPRQLLTQPTTNAGKEEKDTMCFELPPQSSSSEEEEDSF